METTREKVELIINRLSQRTYSSDEAIEDLMELVVSERDALLEFVRDFKADFERFERGEMASAEDIYKQACELLEKIAE